MHETQAAHKNAQDAYQAQLNTKQQEAQALRETLNKSEGTTTSSFVCVERNAKQEQDLKQAQQSTAKLKEDYEARLNTKQQEAQTLQEKFKKSEGSIILHLHRTQRKTGTRFKASTTINCKNERRL